MVMFFSGRANVFGVKEDTRRVLMAARVVARGMVGLSSMRTTHESGWNWD